MIPARGGSKGIPRKNLALLARRPLLQWALDAARAAETVSRVVVSTDDDEIAAAAGDTEVLRRPPELAADETPMLDVIRHAIRELGTPGVLRRPEHIDGAVRLLLDTGADSVVSVVEVPHRYDPDALMELDSSGRLIARSQPSTRQQQPRLYARNGPAVLALRPERLGDALYGGDVRAYVMRERDSLDIDRPEDLELAAILLSPRQARI